MPPPPTPAIVIGVEHSLAFANAFSGVTGALRYGRGALAAELGGSAAFAPEQLDDAALTELLLNDGVPSAVQQRHRYTVRIGADLGLSGPTPPESWRPDEEPPPRTTAPRPRAWGSPHAMLAADVRDVAFVVPALDAERQVLIASSDDHWTFGPTLGLGLAGGYGPHVGARLMALGFLPLVGRRDVEGVIGEEPRTEWTFNIELVVAR